MKTIEDGSFQHNHWLIKPETETTGLGGEKNGILVTLLTLNRDVIF